ncbi:hypothetical protein Tco_1543235, partial [Tanacetum coccineum]
NYISIGKMHSHNCRIPEPFRDQTLLFVITGVLASYGLRRGEIICADTPKEVTHRTANMPKEVTRSPGEDGQVLFFFYMQCHLFANIHALPQLFQMRIFKDNK